jgi:hypothetical protein
MYPKYPPYCHSGQWGLKTCQGWCVAIPPLIRRYKGALQVPSDSHENYNAVYGNCQFTLNFCYMDTSHVIPFEQPIQSGNIESCDDQIWNLATKCCLMIPISSHLRNLPNQAICRVMWPSDLNHMQKCCLMIPISSHLSNLPNQAIYRVMWPSDLKSHRKMLSNDTHIIPFEQPTQSGNIQSHVTIRSEISRKNAV